uniref:Uncharacterized protein n=1 Tax=Romanomermis culicivorax TaxID=13658 RepID=A0A915IIL3_ROMCU
MQFPWTKALKDEKRKKTLGRFDPKQDVRVKVTSTRPGVVRGGTVARMAWWVIISPNAGVWPNITCKPSKKLSPKMITVEPPAVHPSCGHTVLMTGQATTEN